MSVQCRFRPRSSRTKASTYDNSDPCPQDKCCFLQPRKDNSSQQGLEFIFHPLLRRILQSNNTVSLRKNNNVTSNEMHHFKKLNFINLFCTRSENRKSTSGGLQFMGDKLVSWMSKKHKLHYAMSSAEAVVRAFFSSCCAQVMWMRTQLQDYGFNYNKIRCIATLSQP
ncbi:hypothetical protein Tco_1318326 [Tanacetum coccineum]